MCTVCGCSDTQRVSGTVHGARTHEHDGRTHDPSHPHGHEHPPAASHVGMHGETIAMERDILAKNRMLAERNRGWFEGRAVLAVNLMCPALFDLGRCVAEAREVDPETQALQVPAGTGEGMAAWYDRLRPERPHRPSLVPA